MEQREPRSPTIDPRHRLVQAALFGLRAGPVLILLILIAVVAATTPVFRTSNNIGNVLSQTSVISILALGQLLVIVTRGIDLSVGSTIALRDPGPRRQGRQGHRDHAHEPGGVEGARQGDQEGREGRSHGQRHSRLEAEDGRRRHEQPQGRHARGQVPRDEAEGGRHPRDPAGRAGVPALDDRVKGMLNGLGTLRSQIKIVAKLETDCAQDKGLTAVQDILTREANVTAIYGACGPPIIGAVQALKNAGKKPRDVILVGFDALPDELTQIKAGWETASVRAVPGGDRPAGRRNALPGRDGQEGPEERRHRYGSGQGIGPEPQVAGLAEHPPREARASTATTSASGGRPPPRSNGLPAARPSRS